MKSFTLKAGEGIKNIFIDFGVVLLDLEVERSIKRYAELGIDVKLNGQRQSGIFLDIDTGVINEHQFADTLRSLSKTPEKVSYEKILDAHMSIHGYMPPEKLDFVASLKKSGNYNVYAASNISEEGWLWCWRNGFGLKGRASSDYFDKLFLSYEVGAAKPDLKFFEVALAESGANPAESFLIDDSLKNCEVARSLGMRTYSPTPKQSWMGELFNL